MAEKQRFFSGFVGFLLGLAIVILVVYFLLSVVWPMLTGMS